MKYIACSLAFGLVAALAAAEARAAGPAPVAAAPTSIVPPAATTPQVQAAIGNGPTQGGPTGAAGQMTIPTTNGQYGGFPGVPRNVGTPAFNQNTNLNAAGTTTINGVRFGNAPNGTPLGNLQLQTQGNPPVGPPNYNPSAYNNGGYNTGTYSNGGLGGPVAPGVNGAGTPPGGFQNGSFQIGGFQNGGFQNGSFGVGGMNQGMANSGGSPYGTSPYGSPNQAPGSYGAVYGYNPAPGVGNNGTSNPAPPVGLEQSGSEGHFQYGWW